MLALPRPFAWTLAVAAALAAGGTVGARVAGMQPGVETSLTTLAVTDAGHFFELRAWPTGGEEVPVLRLERDPRAVVVIGRDEFRGLRTDNAAMFRLQVSRTVAADPVVRLVGGASGEIVREVTLPVDRPGDDR